MTDIARDVEYFTLSAISSVAGGFSAYQLIDRNYKYSLGVLAVTCVSLFATSKALCHIRESRAEKRRSIFLEAH